MTGRREARLSRLLTLEARDETMDAGGGRTGGWRPLGRCWVEVEPTGGREPRVGGAPNSRVSHRLRLRWTRAGHPARPEPEHRFRDGDRVFAILAVSEADAAGRRLICWAEEGRP